MLRRPATILLAAVVLAACVPPSAHADCQPAWFDSFPYADADGLFNAIVVFDDAGGPLLYAGGDFSTLGGLSIPRIGRWDGRSWSALPGDARLAGTNSTVLSLCVHDDASGPALYAGGFFTYASGQPANRIVRWSGSRWEPLGTGIPDGGVTCLASFDDGSGPALYAGGSFTSAGGVPATYIAKWNGTAWSAVGGGVSGPSVPYVQDLAVFDDDGAGPHVRALYAAGRFTSAGGTPAAYMAKWDGTAWSAVGAGLAGSYAYGYRLAVFDDGGGPALVVGGSFATAGGVPAANIAKWNGSAWSALGSGVNGLVHGLAVWDDDGTGPHAAVLYATGEMTTAGGGAASKIARWNGSAWSALGSGLGGVAPYGERSCAYDPDGEGAAPPRLYVNGNFQSAGGLGAVNFSSWDGTSWVSPSSGPSENVLALALFDDDGAGPHRPALYAGGYFTAAGSGPAKLVACWDGSSWSALGTGLTGTFCDALQVFDDGTGPALYAAGYFSAAGGQPAGGIARWDGSAWSVIPGTSNIVRALAVFDDDGSGPHAPALYAGGGFTSIGGVAANRIARWDGTSWTPLGSGLDGAVRALAVYDPDDTGPLPTVLVVGGEFTNAGGTGAAYVASWNGSAWSGLAGGVNAPVYALGVFDLGTGPALFVGGSFTSGGGQSALGIIRWNGGSWSALGSGVAGSHIVNALALYDDGTGGGAQLYAAGDLVASGTPASPGVARWNGATWSGLGTGLTNGFAYSMCAFDGGAGSRLVVGGNFKLAGGQSSGRLAVWGGCTQTAGVPRGRPEAAITLARARPNPFREGTAISFRLARKTRVEIEVLDVAGRRVRRLIADELAGGPHDTAWNARDQAGRRVEPGLYLLRMRADGRALHQRLIVLR